MKLPHPNLPIVFLGGLVLISMGLASSVGLKPMEAVVPLLSVVGALAVIAVAASSGGPKSLL